MSVEKQTQWENHVQRLAADFPYPATPDLAPTVLALTTRRAPPRWHRSVQPAWVLIFVVVLLLAGLFTIPPVRAALLEWLQIGAVRIQLPASLPPATATQSQNLPAATVVRNQYPPTPTPFSSVLDVAGETTLLAAQAQVNFPLRLPALPADLGERKIANKNLKFIIGGVLERHPTLRTVNLEAGSGWLVPWLYRLQVANQGGRGDMLIPGLSMQPIDYWKRQCFISTEPGDPGIKEVVDALGDECVVVATDFSHPEGRQYVSAPQDVENMAGVSDASKRKIVWDNALRLYPLDMN